jgi:hypothetical protein
VAAFEVLASARLPSGRCTSQAQPEPKVPTARLGELLLELVEAAEGR